MTTTKDPIAQAVDDAMRVLRFDASLGRELEAAVCMYTHFTGDPPYVDTAGLVLAIKEAGEAYRAVHQTKKDKRPFRPKPGSEGER